LQSRHDNAITLNDIWKTGHSFREGTSVANHSTDRPLGGAFPKWFQITFVVAGAVEAFFGILTLTQGPKQVMSRFGIPEVVVNSTHYVDAMSWVVLHMTFLGITQVALGVLAKDPKLQRYMTWLFLMFHSVYAFLDVRASDNPLGTALYQGNASLFPAAISCTFFLLYLHLTVRSLGSNKANQIL
jgi:hypothetical protein